MWNRPESFSREKTIKYTAEFKHGGLQRHGSKTRCTRATSLGTLCYDDVMHSALLAVSFAHLYDNVPWSHIRTTCYDIKHQTSSLYVLNLETPDKIIFNLPVSVIGVNCQHSLHILEVWKLISYDSLRSSFFSEVPYHWLVVCYCHFGTSDWSSPHVMQWNSLTDRLSRNAGNSLPINGTEHPRRAKTSFTLQRKPEITHMTGCQACCSWVLDQMTGFWVVTRCKIVSLHRRFGGTCCGHFQSDERRSDWGKGRCTCTVGC